MDAIHPVVIVGMGPVGMVLAMQLARLGVRSLLLDREAGPRWHPKGSTHNARTMEHYRRLGLADRVRALGLPEDHPTDVAYLTRFDGWELARLAMPSSAEKRAAAARAADDDPAPEPLHRANQMYVERLLFGHLATLPLVERRAGWRMNAFRDRGDRVDVDVECLADGRAETLRCAWLIGCDGGNSSVRKGLGIRYEGERQLEQQFFGGPMVSTHLRIPGLYGRVIGARLRRPAWQYFFIHPAAWFAMVTLNGADEFLVWSRMPARDARPDEAAIVAQIRRVAGADTPVEILAHSPWNAGVALHAERFGAGRVWLAGDAVHLFTPTGGFGMNTGIDDTANLAWKLAAAVQGWAGPALIASYEAERKPIAKRNTLAAQQLARGFAGVPVAPEIDSDTPEGAAARAAAGAVLAGFGEEFASIGVQLGARYDGSPVIVPDGAAPPPDDPAVYVPSGVPGGRAPHWWLRDANGARVSLFDRFAPGFTLLRLGAKAGADTALAAQTDALLAVAARRGVPLERLDVPADGARELYGASLALVRPDGHVAWRGERVAGDGMAVIDRARGA